MQPSPTTRAHRRSFLKASALGCLAPAKAWAAPLLRGERPDRILIHIHMQGGADGLSTLIPYTDDAYYRARPTSATAAASVLKLENDLGFPPVLKPLKRVYDAGQLALLLGVGSQGSSLSHFRATDVIHSAVPGFGVHRHGWLGRARALAWAEEECAELFQHLGRDVPKLLHGPAGSVFSYRSTRLGRLPFATSEPLGSEDSGLVRLIRERQRACSDVMPRIETAIAALPGRHSFPDTALGENLHAIASMIHAGFPTRIYSTTHRSYDSHSLGCGCQEEKLDELGRGVRALLTSLKRSGTHKDVLVLASTEFGRRVHENASGGTDHGAAAHWMLFGEAVVGGMHGELPSVEDLDENGNLKPAVDFRTNCASLLDQWFGIDHTLVLKERLSVPRLVAG